MRPRPGTTPIELLLILLILAITAGVGYRAYTRIRDGAIAHEELQNLALAYNERQEVYFAQHHTYADSPQVFSDLTIPDGVRVIRSTANDTTWLLHLGHQKLSYTCIYWLDTPASKSMWGLATLKTQCRRHHPSLNT